jgi:hypothetical protein
MKIFLILAMSAIFLLNSCGGVKYSPARENPTKGEDRARKNIEEGRGISIGGGLKRGTNYEFSTANPMWRASLETLDFLPLTTVDYSGGMIITDWYSENNFNESIKITVRFLSNEIAAENLKIIIHKKTCNKDDNCKTKLLENSKIRDELISTIVKKAAKLELDSKKKK